MVTRRMLSSEPLSDDEVRKKVDAITEKFFEARELLEDAVRGFTELFILTCCTREWFVMYEGKRI